MHQPNLNAAVPEQTGPSLYQHVLANSSSCHVNARMPIRETWPNQRPQRQIRDSQEWPNRKGKARDVVKSARLCGHLPNSLMEELLPIHQKWSQTKNRRLILPSFRTHPTHHPSLTQQQSYCFKHERPWREQRGQRSGQGGSR